MRNWLALALTGLLACAQPARADDSARLHGLWKLVAYEVESQSTGLREPTMGLHPTGYAVFTPEGRVFFVFTAEGRKPANTVDFSPSVLAPMPAS